MIYLLLSILSSVAIALLFKLSERFGVRVFHIVVLNYFAAAMLGYLLSPEPMLWGQFFHYTWWPMAVLIGGLFIGMFFFIGLATRRVGVAVTTVSTRMSMVLPMLFSVLYYHEAWSATKGLGMVLATGSVLLAIWQPRQAQATAQWWYAPMLFVGAGFIDSVVKLAQASFGAASSPSLFAAVVFSVAAVLGLAISTLRAEPLRAFARPATLGFGFGMGVVNFFSLYFLLQALADGQLASSVVFGLNNLGVVVMSVLVALVLFRETLRWVNWLGVLLALSAVAVLMRV